jgi:hypothetical protein
LIAVKMPKLFQVFHPLLSPLQFLPSAQIHHPRKQCPTTAWERKTGGQRIEGSARIPVLRQRMKKHLHFSSAHSSLGGECFINGQAETEMTNHLTRVDHKYLKCLLHLTGSYQFRLNCVLQWCKAVSVLPKFCHDSWYFRSRLLNLFHPRVVLIPEVLPGTQAPTKEQVLVILFYCYTTSQGANVINIYVHKFFKNVWHKKYKYVNWPKIL